MRRTIIAIYLVLGAASIAGCSAKQEGTTTSASSTTTTTSSVVASNMPKPGLWQMTVTGSSMPSPMTTKMCMGAPTPRANPFTPPPQAGQTCAKNAVTKTANAYAVDTECTVNGMTMSTKGSVSGDFSSSYKMVMTSKMTGANVPAMMQAERTSTAEAKYLGACPADMKPGTVSQGA